MGYAAEKKQISRKKKILFWVIGGILFLCFVGLGLFSFFCPLQTWKYYFSLPTVSKRKAGELRIHFLDVGQGDCTLVELPDNKILLIDGGNGSGANDKKIMRYLNALEIERIDYLVLTHADGDHAGGLDTVLKYKTVKNVYYPYLENPSVNREYAQFYEKLLDENCKKFISERYLTISSKKENYPFTLAFLSPYSLETNADVAGENDDSAVLWLEYQGVSAMFLGDASTAVERRLMQADQVDIFEEIGVKLFQNTDVLKVAHHGSADSTSAEFLEYLQVQTAVISVGKDNAYGHPDGEVLTNLLSKGVETFRTDEKGTVILTVKDGKYTAKFIK